MLLRSLCLFVLIIVGGLCAPSSFNALSDEDDFPAKNEEHDGDEDGTIWALLVAGCNKNAPLNYACQASVLHAYHVLLERAVDPEHIVTIMWDDVAESPNNPFPGKIFNTPDMSTDVYEGARIDYKGEDVTVDNILNVLAGNKDNVTGGNGRVIESTEKDRIFVYFLDHGDVGVFVVFEEDDVDFITAKALRGTLEDMYARKRYAQLTFYMESCFSGSMWNGTRDDINVYAVSSSSAEETSTAKYCPEDCDKHNDSLPCILEDCVGTNFGDNWMFDAEEYTIHETLEDEFGILVYETETYTFNKTGRNQTASQFGDLSITGEPLALFLGRKGDARIRDENYALSFHKRHDPMAMWSFTDAPMKRLELQLRMASDIDDAKRALEGIHSLQKDMRDVDAFLERVVQAMLTNAKQKQKQVLTTRPLMLTQLDCHHEAVHAFKRQCLAKMPKVTYAPKFVNVLANLCEMGLPTNYIIRRFTEVCLHADD